MVIVVTYAGNLFAFLFSPQIEFPINTVDELLEKGETEGTSWGVLGGSVIEQYLKVVNKKNHFHPLFISTQTSAEEKYQLLGERAQIHTASQTVAEGDIFTMIKEKEHV